MSLKLLLGLSMLASAPAFAERAIVVEVEAAPFDATELAAALRVRLPVDGEPVRLRVSAAGDGVRIEAQGNAREVPLGGLRGPAAARLVALAAHDLVMADLASAPEPALAPPSSIRSRDAAHAPTSITVLGAAAAWERTLGGLAIDLAVPRGAWLFTLDAGGSKLIDGPVELSAAVIRLGLGRRLGWFELRAGATFAPVFVGNGVGDRTVLAGAGASVRVRVPITAGVHAVLAGGADVFATRTTYVVGGMTALVTPRGAPWLAAGVEVTP